MQDRQPKIKLNSIAEGHSLYDSLKDIIEKISGTIDEINNISKSNDDPEIKGEALLFRLTNLGESFNDLKKFIEENNIQVSDEYMEFIKKSVGLRNKFVHNYNMKYSCQHIIAGCSHITALANKGKEEVKKILVEKTKPNEASYDFSLLNSFFDIMDNQFPHQQQIVSNEADIIQRLKIVQYLIQKLNIFNESASNFVLKAAIQNCITTILVMVSGLDHNLARHMEPLISSLSKELTELIQARGKAVHDVKDLSQEIVKKAINTIIKLEPVVNSTIICFEQGYVVRNNPYKNYFYCDSKKQNELHDKAVEDEKVKYKVENSELKKEKNALKEAKDKLEKEKEKADQSNSSLTNKNKEFNTNLTKTAVENQSLKQEVDSLREQNKNLNEKFRIQEKKLTENDKNLSNQLDTVKKLSEDKSKITSELEKAEKEVTKLNKEVKEYKNKEAQLTKTNQELKKNSGKELSLKIEKLEKESKEEKEKYKKDIEQKSKERIEVLNTEKKAISTRLLDSNTENTKLKAELKSIKEEKERNEKVKNEKINQQEEEIKQLNKTNNNLITASAVGAGVGAVAAGAFMGSALGGLLPEVGGSILSVAGGIAGGIIAAGVGVVVKYAVQNTGTTTTSTSNSNKNENSADLEDTHSSYADATNSLSNSSNTSKLSDTPNDDQTINSSDNENSTDTELVSNEAGSYTSVFHSPNDNTSTTTTTTNTTNITTTTATQGLNETQSPTTPRPGHQKSD